MQETKCADEEFPRKEFEKLGYNVETVGQSSHNGVAILSLLPLGVERRSLPGSSGDDQARYLQALIQSRGPKQRRTLLRVASLYIPNGNPIRSDKFAYKLDWMARLIRHARQLLCQKEVLVLGGDYNVAPTDGDIYDPMSWANDALCREETRAKYRELLKLGLIDLIAARSPGPGNYTFWDYQARAWDKNQGWRIDHLLVSTGDFDRVTGCGIDKETRGGDKPSDHVPVWCDIKNITARPMRRAFGGGGQGRRGVWPE